MSTSTDKYSKAAAKRTLAYVIITMFTALCGGVYELFGHGVYSYYMLYAFAIPLVCGVLPNLIAAVRGLPKPHKVAYNLYNSGVATLTAGSVFEGVLEIYGTTNDLIYVYLIAGLTLLWAGIIAHIICGMIGKKYR